jgi:type IV pilus assembly protein PilE
VTTVNRSGSKAAGFTLIEMMIAIVVVGILLMVALPGYQQHALKSKRSLGRAELQEVMARQEQYFVNNRQYATSLADLGLANPYAIDADANDVAADSANRIYTIALASATALAYTLTATPQLGQADDTQCGTLQITSTGVKSATGSAGAVECW